MMLLITLASDVLTKRTGTLAESSGDFFPKELSEPSRAKQNGDSLCLIIPIIKSKYTEMGVKLTQLI